MKKISVLIPCYNERENIVPMSEAVENIMTSKLKNYDYEIIFIDNNSTDGTRDILKQLCLQGGGDQSNTKRPKLRNV